MQMIMFVGLNVWCACSKHKQVTSVSQTLGWQGNLIVYGWCLFLLVLYSSETSESEESSDETESSISEDTWYHISWVRTTPRKPGRRRRGHRSPARTPPSESSGNSELEVDSDDNLSWRPKQENRYSSHRLQHTPCGRTDNKLVPKSMT